MKKEPHVAKYKKDLVEDFARLIKEYPIIGAVNLENLPAPQLNKMRLQLRGMVVLKMGKRRLLKLAIEKAKKDKPGIEKIEQYLKGMPALLFTKENPFKLYKIVQKSKSTAPAKAGQTAPYDIAIPAGPTPFAPGPIIGELGMLGIKTSVEGGKVAVVKDSIVVKEGEEIKPKVAGLLTRFGIEPMEIGLDIVAVYENGTIYKKNVLAIDEKKFMQDLQNAHRWAFNLAVEAGYYTKEVVETIIPKAFNEAKALAREANIMCDLLAEEMVEKAERQALSLKTEAKIPEAAEEKPKPKEEPKVEEKKPEPVKEEKSAEPEPPKEEPKVEEKKPEPVKEEKSAEPEPPKEEPKKEEKKPEPKPEPVKEEKPKEEPKIEEAKPEEIPEPEEKKPEPVKEEPKKEEIKEKLEKIEEEVKEEQAKPEPKIEEVEKIEEEVKEVEKEIPSAHELKLKRDLDTEEPKPKKEHVEAENLYEELKKKGTLRGVEKEKEEEKPKGKLSPQEIIEQHKKKIEENKE